MQTKLYHLGFGSTVARSTLADANEAHDWRIFADFAQHLIWRRPPLHVQDPIGVDLDDTLYALDSTAIDLCLALFPWAKFHKTKGAVKLHTLLDLQGNIPTFIGITEGKVHDVNIVDQIVLERGAFYVMERGYVDFRRLYVFKLCSSFFVTRTKDNVLLQRRYSRGRQSHGRALGPDRNPDGESLSQSVSRCAAEITYVDNITEKRLGFLTNNFVLPALTIARIYKCRWQVGVSSQGHIVQPVRDRPRPIDSGLVAWEAPWRGSKTVKPSDNMLRKECARRTRLQCKVNADVASLHYTKFRWLRRSITRESRKGWPKRVRMRQLSPAGYQRRHGVKD